MIVSYHDFRIIHTIQLFVRYINILKVDKSSSGYFPGVWVLKADVSGTLTLHQLLKMEPTQCSETSAFNTQAPGKYPEDNLSLLQQGESLKTGILKVFSLLILLNIFWGGEDFFWIKNTLSFRYYHNVCCLTKIS